MRRREGQRGVDIGERLRKRLSRQAVHQVEVEIVEVRGGDLDGALCLKVVVDAAQRREMSRVEALDTERKPVDSGVAEGGEFLGFDRARIGFQRDFGVRQNRQQGANGGEQAVEPHTGKQTGCAAAKKDARHLAPPDQRQGRFEIRDQGTDVLVFGNVAQRLMRVEIAIRTLLHAPRNMHVERERWRVAEFEYAGRRSGWLALFDDGNDA